MTLIYDNSKYISLFFLMKNEEKGVFAIGEKPRANLPFWY